MRRLDVRKRIQLQYQRLLFILAAVQRRAEMWGGHFKCIGRGWRYKAIGSAGNEKRPISPGRGAVYGGELVECMQYRSCNSVFSPVSYTQLDVYKRQAMWPAVGATDFPSTCTKFQVPYFIFDGVLDQNTPAALVQD